MAISQGEKGRYTTDLWNFINDLIGQSRTPKKITTETALKVIDYLESGGKNTGQIADIVDKGTGSDVGTKSDIGKQVMTNWGDIFRSVPSPSTPNPSMAGTIDRLTKIIYGGDDPNLIRSVQALIWGGFEQGGKSIRSELKKFAGGGSTEYVENEIDQVGKTEYQYNKNPQKYIESEIKRIRETPYGDLTDDELNATLANLEKYQSTKEVEVSAPSKISIGRGISGSDWVTTKKQVDAGDLSGDIKSIRDIIAQRGEYAKSEEEIGRFLGEAPSQLAGERAAFFKQQRGQARDVMQSYLAPNIIEQLNVRGLARSGDVGDVIASRYGEIESTISQAEMAQTEADIQMFADMSYKTELQKLAEARGDVRAQTQYEYGKLRQQQQQRFLTQEREIQSSFDMDMFRRENQRIYNEYLTATSKNEAARKSQQEAEQWATVGQVGGQIGSAALIGAIG